MEKNKNKKSVKFQGDMLNFYGFIHVFIFTTNHHLKDIHCRSFSEKPYKAYQMKRFEKEFCFFSAFDSLNLLKQKDIQVVIIARKRPKIVIILAHILFYLCRLFVTLFVHSCTSRLFSHLFHRFFIKFMKFKCSFS